MNAEEERLNQSRYSVVPWQEWGIAGISGEEQIL